MFTVKLIILNLLNNCKKNKRFVRYVKFFGYVLSLISTTIIGRYLFLHYRRKIIGLPPGVIGLPIFGCLFSLAFHPKKLLEHTCNKYGKICTIRIGNKDIVIINDVKLCQKLNINTELNLNRPPSNISVWGYPSYALNDNGEKWKAQKNIVMKTFFSQINSGFIHSIFFECFNNIILPEIKKNLNKPYKPAKIIDFFTFSVHYLALFEDKIIDLNDPKFLSFREGMGNVMKQMSAFLTANKLPTIFRWILYDHNKTMYYNKKLLFT
eukprot:529569_1